MPINFRCETFEKHGSHEYDALLGNVIATYSSERPLRVIPGSPTVISVTSAGLACRCPSGASRSGVGAGVGVPVGGGTARPATAVLSGTPRMVASCGGVVQAAKRTIIEVTAAWRYPTFTAYPVLL